MGKLEEDAGTSGSSNKSFQLTHFVSTALPNGFSHFVFFLASAIQMLSASTVALMSACKPCFCHAMKLGSHKSFTFLIKKTDHFVIGLS